METEEETEPVVYASSELVRSFKLAALPQGMRCSISVWERPSHKSHAGANEGEDKEVKMTSLAGVGSGTAGAGAEKEKEKERVKVQARVKEAKGLENGHVWIGGRVRKELGLGAEAEDEERLEGGGFELIR